METQMKKELCKDKSTETALEIEELMNNEIDTYNNMHNNYKYQWNYQECENHCKIVQNVNSKEWNLEKLCENQILQWKKQLFWIQELVEQFTDNAVSISKVSI